MEAVSEGQVSGSAWGAPLWVPYGCMALGMTLLVLELMAQVITKESLQHVEAQ